MLRKSSAAILAWPSRRDWVFSVKTFAAAMLALYIALALGLSRPYWAMASVYIVSHPLTGATRSKALYRVFGTLLGAGASIVFVPALVQAPELLMAVVALWTGSLLYIALLHRTPRSYVFMLAAYTLPLIALPSVGSPEGIFDIAVSRAEEIILGIICASIVGGVFWPSNVAGVLRDKSIRWLTDAAQWTTDMLSNDPDGKAARHHSRHRLAADILALDQLISQLSYDTESAARVRDAQELRGRMTMLVPVLATVASLVDTLRKHPDGVPTPLAQKMADVAGWIRMGIKTPPPARIAQPPVLPNEGSDWYKALVSATEDRLRSLVELWQDCAELQHRLGETKPQLPWVPTFKHWEVGGARHYDHGLLLFSTGSAALAIFLMGMIWIWTGWNDGASAVALGAVACCFFAALDEPAPRIRSFFWATLACVVFAAVYLFFILTNAHDFGLLVALFAVPYLLLGTLLAQPRFALIALPLAVNTASFVGIQGAYSADFPAFLNSNLAGVAGILFALIWTLQTRPYGARVAMRRLVHSSWRDIAENAVGRPPVEHGPLRARLLDRLGQLVPRLAASENESSTDGFTEVRVELSALALQRDLPTLPSVQKATIVDVLQDIAQFYRERLARRAVTPSFALHEKLLVALRALSHRTDQPSRSVRASLMDIHVALLPKYGIELSQ